MTSVRIPDENDTDMRLGRRTVRLTNLSKPFWPHVAKRDLLQYYSDVATAVIPHVADRPMVMKRYPNGYRGEYFFMKRAPAQRPAWIRLCPVEHGSGSSIDFPIVRDVASLLWMVNLGCIDLNPWYATCDDIERPDFLHFDLDPVKPATFEHVLETALVIRGLLDAIDVPSFAKTTGSRGMHIYVPIVRQPTSRQVWETAKSIALRLARDHPKLITAVYRVAERPRGLVLVDYNQNALGRTLASVYSVRPRPRATVSAPVTWREVERGVRIEDFRIDNMVERIRRKGELWAPLLARRNRVPLRRLTDAY